MFFNAFSSRHFLVVIPRQFISCELAKADYSLGIL